MFFGRDAELEIKEERERACKLEIENGRLKIDVETLRFKLEQAEEKYSIVENKLRKMENTDIEKVKQKNISLSKELNDLKFKMQNKNDIIELETQNRKLEAEIELQKSENNYLKELLDTYRSMPDVKNMIDNLSSLAIPHIDELKNFAEIVSDSKVDKLYDELLTTNEQMKDVIKKCNDTIFYNSGRYIDRYRNY